MATKALAQSLGLVSNPLLERQHHPHKRPQLFHFLIVLDFEATCWEDKKKQPHPGEIIEFPAVLLDCDTGRIEETFHHYVMPTECTVLPEFCTKLTGIQQETVNKADTLPAVMKLFSDWLKKICTAHEMVINPSTEQIDKKYTTFVTWSDWDLGTQLLYECKRKSIFRASHFNAWIDLKLRYKQFYKLIPRGLNGALEERGMMFVGREHSGIDDAKNTARLVFRMICDGCRFTVTKSIQGKQVVARPSSGTRKGVIERPCGGMHKPVTDICKLPVLGRTTSDSSAVKPTAFSQNKTGSGPLTSKSTVPNKSVSSVNNLSTSTKTPTAASTNRSITKIAPNPPSGKTVQTMNLASSKTTVSPPLCKCSVLSVRKQTLNGGPHHGRYYFTCWGKMCNFYIWESKVVENCKKLQ